jgi:hypothetical protein
VALTSEQKKQRAERLYKVRVGHVTPLSNYLLDLPSFFEQCLEVFPGWPNYPKRVLQCASEIFEFAGYALVAIFISETGRLLRIWSTSLLSSSGRMQNKGGVLIPSHLDSLRHQVSLSRRPGSTRVSCAHWREGSLTKRCRDSSAGGR